MAKVQSIYICSECGQDTAKWMGRCPGCGQWNTLIEERVDSVSPGGSAANGASPAVPVQLKDVADIQVERLKSGMEGFDLVLGGGIVPGSLVLLGGSPGIGKSTLLNQVLASLAGRGVKTLYVSGEESAAQVRLRAERLGAQALQVPVVSETALETVISTLAAERPQVCVVDSVQTLYSDRLASVAGSVAQVREVAGSLLKMAKRESVAVLLVGHVTKDGSLAGPRVLEHMVDCVLQFEGDRHRTYRLLRAHKNRFGSTDELGLYEMRGEGLAEVVDVSAHLLEGSTGAPGSCMLATIEGTRPLLVEVQALVSGTEIIPPRRVVNGIDRNRLSMVLAILARHGGISLGGSDVFVNLAGGVQSSEPGADLAVALAVASAAKGISLTDGQSRDGRAAQLVAFGELGLTGEVRHVQHPRRRLAEAGKFGLDWALTPPLEKSDRDAAGEGAHQVGTLRQALQAALS